MNFNVHLNALNLSPELPWVHIPVKQSFFMWWLTLFF